MSELVERLKEVYQSGQKKVSDVTEAYKNGQQIGSELKPQFVRLHGARRLDPYHSLHDLLQFTLRDLVHDAHLLTIKAPRTAYYLSRSSRYEGLERVAYIMGSYKSLQARSSHN